MEAIKGLFVQVLSLCRDAGMVKLGHVALDGTKMKANASKHAAMSYARMKKREPELAQLVAEWMEAARSADEEEDQEHGPDRRGDEGQSRPLLLTGPCPVPRRTGSMRTTCRELTENVRIRTNVRPDPGTTRRRGFR